MQKFTPNPAIYEQAAESLASHDSAWGFCCHEIEYACVDKPEFVWRHDYLELFTEYFMPECYGNGDVWFTSNHPTQEQCVAGHEHRIWALLFMAEIAKDLK
jgi:hypothetical protein